MVVHSAIFTAIRVLEVLVAIPIIGMIGYFVDPYVKNHARVPDNLLTIFIVSILACAYALVTLFQFKRFRAVTGPAIAVLDIAFTGAFIASVVLLRGIAKADCAHLSVPLGVTIGGNTYGSNRWSARFSKGCAMMKASWILAIVECVLFFITAIVSWTMYRSYKYGARTTHTEKSYGRRSGSTSTYNSHRHRHHRRTYV